LVEEALVSENFMETELAALLESEYTKGLSEQEKEDW
jgi:hypothetical protein